MIFDPEDTLLNKYRVEELIGRGAFAEVYRATHVDLNVPRALKVLRRDSPGVGSSLFDDYEQRFRLEVQLGARLNHPNVIQVHDVERDGDDLILVMEYAPKGSLAEKIQQARDLGKTFAIDNALKIVAEIATGLGKLHSLDAVHRDLKPSNILFDAEGIAKIADFGLAQVPGGPSMRSQLSQPVQHPGTAGYMSPEQENSTSFLKPSSDVYALGVILFELMAGRNYHYIQPGTKASDLRGKVPKWLDDLLARLLAKDPEQRPWDGEQAAKLLQEGYDSLVTELSKSEQLEREKLEKKKADRQKRQAEEASKQRLHEERARKSAERKQKQAERRAKRAETGTRFMERISTFMKRWWKLIGIILLVPFVILMITRQYASQERPFLPTATTTATVAEIIPTLSETPLPTRTPTMVPPSPTVTQTPGPTEVPLSEMAFVPSGWFMMGATSSQLEDVIDNCVSQGRDRSNCESWYSDEESQSIDLEAFWIDKTEVTNAMFAVFLNENGNRIGPGEMPWLNDNNDTVRIHQVDGIWVPDSGYGNHPVAVVSYHGAQAYCEWISRRLPTSTEWEKAARGGLQQEKYPWGSEDPVCEYDANNGAKFDNDSDCDNSGSEPVMSYSANGFELYDMAGNVAEWASEYWVSPHLSIVRGGSFYDSAIDLRITYQAKLDLPSVGIGFRCASDTAP